MSDYQNVALLAEGVDRNDAAGNNMLYINLSPSSRRAWIEIAKGKFSFALDARRPPRGGRG